MNIKMKRSMKKKKQHDINYKDISWKVIESYFQGQHLERLVRHQIESYNNFINYQIKKTIEMFNPVTIHSEHDKDRKNWIIFFGNDNYV